MKPIQIPTYTNKMDTTHTQSNAHTFTCNIKFQLLVQCLEQVYSSQAVVWYFWTCPNQKERWSVRKICCLHTLNPSFSLVIQLVSESLFLPVLFKAFPPTTLPQLLEATYKNII